MKKLFTILLLLIGVFILAGCTNTPVDEDICGSRFVEVEGVCIEKETFCASTQEFIDGKCSEIVCEAGEEVINRECAIPEVTCLPYEDIIDGECIDTYECKTDPNSEVCQTISKQLVCEAGGDAWIDGVCFGDNQTCSTTQELRNKVCIDLTACEIDENSQACELVKLEEQCILDGNIFENDSCTIVCEVNEVLINGECQIIIGDQNFLDIYYLNDFHGAIINDGPEMGLARIANLILTAKENNPDNTLFITGGDILQGSALSNYFIGESTIEILDLSKLDAFILGNHEFDWGLEEVTKYFDEIEENGEADFPLLAANVFYKGTTDIPEFIEPYTIVQKGNLKIGIIGVIGSNLESSIATSKVQDYEFVYALPIIEELSAYLRGTEGCDIVIVVAHDSGGINTAVSELTGLSKIDAIFNGHSHQSYVEGTNIPVIQSGSNGKYVGHVRFNLVDGEIVSYLAENLDMYDDALLQTENQAVQDLIDFYSLQTDDLFSTPIITPDEYLSSGDLTSWIASVIRAATGSDIAFHNFGGTRRSINDGEVINLSVLYEVWPFDNVIKTVYLTGSVINDFMSSGNGYSTDITVFEDDVMYKVATNDYLFDKENNPFLTGTNIENTGLLLRDLAVDEFTLQSYIYSFFYLSNDIQTEYYPN